MSASVVVGPRPALYKEHDPYVEVHLGPDLIAVICVGADGGRMASDRWHVLAFDADGNYLSTLATVHGFGVPDAVQAAAFATARALYLEA